ncbi:MAG: AraC family transcriptional regulator [Xanthomonadales bacterium]|nr:AraC family transcriptional regulator [Xanthomonadales bacterium]
MKDAKSTLEKHQYHHHVVLKRRTTSAVFAEERYECAVQHPMHDHAQANFLLTDNCGYREQLGSKTFHHSVNTIIWRPGEFSHADGLVRDNGRLFCVYIKDELMRQFADYAKTPAEFSQNNSYLVFLARRLRDEFRNWSQGSELIAEGLVLEMLGHAARADTRIQRVAPLWLDRIVEKLECEFLQDHTNERLAREAGVHPVHLSRTFRQHCGKSVGRFIKEKRVHHAMLLIEQGRMTLAEIASASGFSDQSHLSRGFKQVVGITPGAFRRDVRPPRRM